MKRIWLLILGLGATVIIGFSIPKSVVAFDPFGNGVCQGAAAGTSTCQASSDDSITGNNGLIIKAANILAIATGVAAVIVIIIGGLQFILSSGDSTKISQARQAIIYAAVGIVVAIVGRLIVGFVVARL